MYEIDGTAYTNKSAYRRCLEKMKANSVAMLRLIKRMYHRVNDPEQKKLIEEAYANEMEHLAYAHFNIAWLDHPDIMHHYPAKCEEREGANDDTNRS